MSEFKYKVTGDGDSKTVVVLVNGDLHTAQSTHPNFNTIVAAVEASNDEFTDEKMLALFSISDAVTSRLERLSVRVTVRDNSIFFDEEDKTETVIGNTILRFLDSGEGDWTPLVFFWENVEANPNEHSKEQLFRWLKTHDFTITSDGHIVGYKGVNNNLTSIYAGPAIVNGNKMNGHIPNDPGNVITMPRSSVQHAPGVGCSTGLHVGTWDYASGFGNVVLEVHVDPRDVVSVPTDCSDAKMRTCRYEVVGVVNRPYTGAVLADDVDNDWEGDGTEWDENCPECGAGGFDGECYNTTCDLY